MSASTWIDDAGKLVARLANVFPAGRGLVVTPQAGRVHFFYKDAHHSIELSVSSSFRILHHLDGFAEQVGASLLRPGAFLVGSDAQGRDQLVEITRTRPKAWSRMRAAYGLGVHGRIHYKTRPPGKERRLFVHVED